MNHVHEPISGGSGMVHVCIVCLCENSSTPILINDTLQFFLLFLLLVDVFLLRVPGLLLEGGTVFDHGLHNFLCRGRRLSVSREKAVAASELSALSVYQRLYRY